MDKIVPASCYYTAPGGQVWWRLTLSDSLCMRLRRRPAGVWRWATQAWGLARRDGADSLRGRDTPGVMGRTSLGGTDIYDCMRRWQGYESDQSPLSWRLTRRPGTIIKICALIIISSHDQLFWPFLHHSCIKGKICCLFTHPQHVDVFFFALVKQ